MQASESAARNPGSRRAATALAVAHVLVVDDYAEVLASVGRVLARAGHQVSAFGSRRDFIRTPCPAPPYCVLLDIDMPELARLRSGIRTRNLR